MPHFPTGIISMKLKVSTFEQEISSASLGNNSIQINEQIKNAFNNQPAGTIFNPSIAVTYSDTAFPSVSEILTPTVIPNYVPKLPPPPLSLLSNNMTIKYDGLSTDVADDSARFIQADPRGTGMEWFAVVKNGMKSAIGYYSNGIDINFIPPGESSPVTFNNIVTTLMTDMSSIFYGAPAFNQPIGSWDTSNVTNMYAMFFGATVFNQPIDSWDTSSVTNMDRMFVDATAFNKPMDSWNTSSVTNMNFMFSSASSFNQPIGSWDTSSVTNMGGMFEYGRAFNQDISGWNVANVTPKPPNDFRTNSALTSSNEPVWNPQLILLANGVTIKYDGNPVEVPASTAKFIRANPRGTGMEWFAVVKNDMKTAINLYARNYSSDPLIPPGQSSPVPLNNIVTTLMTDMSFMFNYNNIDHNLRYVFNHPIDSWDTSNVTNMANMFSSSKAFNQPLSSWDTSKVTDMSNMFSSSSSFNQNISEWNVSLVTAYSAFRVGSPLITNYTPLAFR